MTSFGILHRFWKENYDKFCSFYYDSFLKNYFTHKREWQTSIEKKKSLDGALSRKLFFYYSERENIGTAVSNRKSVTRQKDFIPNGRKIKVYWKIFHPLPPGLFDFAKFFWIFFDQKSQIATWFCFSSQESPQPDH